MRNLIFFLALVIYLPVFSQVDRTKVPKAGPAPEIRIGDFKSFVLSNGLKVFVIENHRVPMVTYSLTFVNTPVLEKEFSGLSEVTYDMLGTATTHRTKEQINDEIDFLGASFSASSSGVYASSLKKNTAQLTDIFSDIVINAIFNDIELQKVKTKTLSGIAANKTDPVSIAGDVINVLNFGKNHPYGEIITETSVKNINLDRCKAYYDSYIRPNVAYLSIVGDITLAEAKPLIEKYFASWKQKEVSDFKYAKPSPPKEREIAIVNRDESVQSVINVGYPIDVTLSNPDYIKARVANTILGGGTYRLFNNLREKHGYTYGAYSSLISMPLSGSFTASTNVRNEVTDSALFQVIYEMNNIRNSLVPDDELKRAKNYMTGNFALALENPQTIASFAVNIERYKLPKDYYKNYLKNLNNVTSSDVQIVSRKYILPDNCNVLVVGKATEISAKLRQFGKLTFYTEEGEPYDSVTGTPIIPDSLTAFHILNKYVEVIGGKSKLSQVRDLRQVGSVNAPGLEASVIIIQKFPDKVFNEIRMGDKLLNRQILFGNKASAFGSQGKEEVDGLTFDLLKLQGLIFPEDKLEQLGYFPFLRGVEKIDGKNNYKVEINTPSGGLITEYFDMDTGLRSQMMVNVDGPEGPVQQITDYLEYNEVEGIKIPHRIKQSLNNKSFEITINNIEINTNPTDDIFK
jgi:predicted Zn-dependent peptidase